MITSNQQTSPGTCAGHTPGPWTAKIMRGTIPITGASGGRVAYAFQGASDARIIAAAPQMLEALRGALDYCCMVGEISGVLPPIASDIAAVIATATGKGGAE